MISQAKVLLVDDEPETQRLVRKILQAEGYEVVEASDGQEALNLYHTTSPDLVLLDIIIPKLDGIGVLKEIRLHDSLTTVIMVSALTSEKLTLDAMMAGADDYLTKPFALREMRIRVRKGLESGRLRRENVRLQTALDAALTELAELKARLQGQGNPNTTQ